MADDGTDADAGTTTAGADTSADSADTDPAGDDIATEGADGTDTGTGETGTWCADTDGDGFGDPQDCLPTDDPPPGYVEDDGDCDDTSPYVFPGAAPNDDPDACMEDVDGDDWGDDEPPLGVEAGTDCADDNTYAFPGAAELESTEICEEDADEDGWGDIAPPEGVEAGTDCDDSDPFAFPGAAELENPPGSCMVDADDDGWGDAHPGGGITGGSDCYDGNTNLNPSTMHLTTFLTGGDGLVDQTSLVKVSPLDGGLTPLTVLQDLVGGDPGVDISTATIDEHGVIVVNDLESVDLESIDYGGVCMGETSTIQPLGASYGLPGDILCGLEFGPDGLLHGLDHDDNLLTFSPATGQLLDVVPVMTQGIPLNISSCGMAYDCSTDRLLVANGVNKTIYTIDPATGTAESLINVPDTPPWDPVGLEFDPVDHVAYLSTGTKLYRVSVDGAEPPSHIGGFPAGVAVSNLQNLPLCL